MKTLLTVICGSLLWPALALAAPPSPAQSPAQAPLAVHSAKAVQGPLQAPAAVKGVMQAPMQPVQAPLKTAQADSGYRTYSYQPGAAAPAYTSYDYESWGLPRRDPAFRGAADKVLGRYP